VTPAVATAPIPPRYVRRETGLPVISPTPFVVYLFK
jgi:hypothetical protein